MIWIGVMALTVCMFTSPNNGDGGLPAVDGHAFFNLPEFCACCHDEGGREGDVEPHGFTIEITEICMRCHTSGEIGGSHPVDVVPTDRFPDMEVPEEMPLDAQDRMTCGTCHNPHLPGHTTERYVGEQDAAGTRVVDGYEVEFFKSYRLRAHAPDAGNGPTCMACHREY